MLNGIDISRWQGNADLAGQARARWGMWPADVREAALVKVIALTGQLKEDTT